MHQSLNGCLSEAIFITECLKRNIPIYQPIADVYGVDFVVGNNLLKVQVKSTHYADTRYKTSTTYKVQCRHGSNKKYDDHFDYLAAYLAVIDTWYIIPLIDIDSKCIRINPDSDKCKYKNYNSAFDLLGG